MSALDVTVAGRVRRGLRNGENWLQLLRFGIVGASGYVVNLVVFWLAVHPMGTGHRLAATAAFLIALGNNFLWNRIWTFKTGTQGRVHHQAARFFAVSLAGFAVNLVVLEALVSAAGLPDLPAQAIAVAVAMPVNFLGNRYWTFRG
jgi:dolichol-phosphate mannosyltransferase